MQHHFELETQQLNLANQILDTDKISPFYQPKVCLHDGKVVGFEALLRWSDENEHLRLPSEIDAAFQNYALASRISETMQLKIFQHIRHWLDQGHIISPISINAAPVEFLQDNYAELLLERLDRFNIPYHHIEIEITEQSLSLDAADHVIRALNLLKNVGIRIALDDFGTGYSSLARLKQYPIHCIKIDKNFVKDLPDDSLSIAIIQAITQIGSSTKIEILVEGIENIEQLNMLKACNCNTGQGFYFYKPMSFQQTSILLSHS